MAKSLDELVDFLLDQIAIDQSKWAEEHQDILQAPEHRNFAVGRMA